MPLDDSQIFGTAGGKQYVFGFQAANAPVITNATARKAMLDVEPEMVAYATDGEGHVEAMAVSLPAKRKISVDFECYINSSFNSLTLPNTTTFLGRFFVFKKCGVPYNKGEFVAVSISYESHSLVTS